MYAFLCVLLISANLLAQKNKTLNLVAGTFAEDGLQVFDFNPETRDLRVINKVKTGGAIFITTTSDYKHLYTVTQENNEGFVYSFEFDPKTAELKFLNKVSSKGSSPSYITLDEKENYAFVSHYMSGNVGVFPIQKDGTLGEATQVIQHTGKGPNPQRQDRPRAHSAVFTPDHKYLMVGELGLDKIMMYRFDPSNKTEPLSPASIPYFNEKPGSGSRMIVIHPSKKFIYTNQEIAAEVTGYTYKDGILTKIQTVPMVTDTTAENVRLAADIQISPDGKFLYASNRANANDIVIYSIDSKTGKLEFKGRQSSLGRSPRYFAIDPTGDYLIVSNMGMGGGRRGGPPGASTPGQPVAPQIPPPMPSTIIVFKRDQATGLLTDTGKKIDILQPGFLLFVPK